MKPWNFSAPKTPGFGISSTFYTSVLTASSQLPTVLQLGNPKGADGAVSALIAPLSKTAAKESLSLPLERGTYACASPDRKTVLRMTVVNRGEFGFEPEQFAQSALANMYSPDTVNRIRASWHMVQYIFESHDAAVYPALEFLQSLQIRLANLADGVIADPISRRYMLPSEIKISLRSDPVVDAREWVAVHTREQAGQLNVFTLGLQKFALPEFEIAALSMADIPVAERFLLSLSQNCLKGNLTKSGDRFGSNSLFFECREGGYDKAFWGGTTVFDLLPPLRETSSQVLKVWEKG